MSYFVRLFPVLAVVAHGALWFVAMTTLGRLEGPYPTKFDAAGHPSHYSEGGAWILPVLGLFVLVMALGVAALGRYLAVKRPEIVNLPRKREWLKLPVEARLRVMAPVKTLLYGIALFTNLLMLSIVIDTYAVAIGQATSLPTTRLYLAVGGILILIALSWVQIRRKVGDELRVMRRDAQG